MLRIQWTRGWIVSVLAMVLWLLCNPLQAGSFARGADVGWLSEMEKSGVKFRGYSGGEQDCLRVLQGLGMDSIRLRVWVNPSEGWCGKADVVAMAKRAKALGMRLMVDFHYSDFWADPGKQNKPSAWANHSLEQLNLDVATHTTEVLLALKEAGVTPEWVQVGNETNDGMLWEEGRASKSMSAFASLVNSGHDAVKSVFPQAKVLVHLSNGYDKAMFSWMIGGLISQGARFDVIAMSLYPDAENWTQRTEQTLETMRHLIQNYGKEIMISEVGMRADQPQICKAFLTDILAKVKSLPDGMGLGVFYWEPQCYGGWKAYELGAFTSEGRPSAALEAFGTEGKGAVTDRVMNISTRSWVGTDFLVQTAGFVISGGSPRRVLMRATGPGLAPFGVEGVLLDPLVELFEQRTNTVLASNDDWSSHVAQANALEQAAEQVGAFAWQRGSKDAGLLLTLAPGAYSLVVKGKARGTGVALVEVYDAQL